MKRKIYDKLLEWKKRKGEVALFIDGARRVGKTYIAEEFAKKEYKSYILIDFYKDAIKVSDDFNYHLDDLNTLFLNLSIKYNTKLYERETLFIFDEVQFFPRARAAIKYLVQDGRYDFIETGSLVSIKKNVKDILIPSEEHHVKMFPMDYEEFLWAVGNDTLMPYIKKCFDEKKRMGQALHRKAINLFRLYLVVGGMPQAVIKYVNAQKPIDFSVVDQVKREILELYRNDIIKHAEGMSLKVERIFDEIPSQLQKHEKKFNLASINKEARLREYEDSFMWLDDAMIINPAFNSSSPDIGLKLNEDRTTMKCYMLDTGLLISHSFEEKESILNSIYLKIMTNKLEFNKGMITENIVAQMLRTSGHKLYFYSVHSDDKDERMKIDFLIAKDRITSRHNISPIEVKSGSRYSLTSLNKFIKKYKERLHTPYIVHTQDLRIENGICFLPIYMVPLL